MRTTRLFLSAGLGFLVLCAAAHQASAQTYVWTDERGVVHAAADPSEVPAPYRQKSIENAQVQRPTMTVVPDDAPPAAAAPMHVEPDAAAPAPHHRAAPPDPSPQAAAANPDDPDPRTRKLGKPDPGFEWHCLTDPEGGPPKCTQEEKKYDKRARRADARAKAEAALGATPEAEASDPDLQRKVDKLAEKEFNKTTPTPTHGAAKKSDDEGDAEDQD
jgi:hypothetical protein